LVQRLSLRRSRRRCPRLQGVKQRERGWLPYRMSALPFAMTFPTTKAPNPLLENTNRMWDTSHRSLALCESVWRWDEGGSTQRSRTTDWWARQDSNLRPTGYEPAALTSELRAPQRESILAEAFASYKTDRPASSEEPQFARWWRFREVIQSGRRDSNPRISAWKADALPLGHARAPRIVTFAESGVKPGAPIRSADRSDQAMQPRCSQRRQDSVVRGSS
jgi:hypothetical protein